MDDASLESELLLRHTLGMSREALLARLQRPTEWRGADEPSKRSSNAALAREPTQYITGRSEFYGLELMCSPAALIPRPETELLVELSLEWAVGRASRVARPSPLT